ncbi:aminoacyl-tRNA deacylase [Thermococcus sp.]
MKAGFRIPASPPQSFQKKNVKPSHVIKSLLFIADDGPLLVIVDGESRASLKKLEKLFGNVRMAKPAEVKAITGYAVGGVPPVGVPVRTVVDRHVLERDVVIGGGGRIDRLIRIKPGKIVEFQKAEVLDIAE